MPRAQKLATTGCPFCGRSRAHGTSYETRHRFIVRAFCEGDKEWQGRVYAHSTDLREKRMRYSREAA